jgi:hypothetical protein
MGVLVMRAVRHLAAAAVLTAAAGCGASDTDSSERCSARQAEYVAAVAEARRCDPQAADPCGGTVPGNMEAQCPVAVRPEQVEALNALFVQYQHEGCTLGFVAPCVPQPSSSCEQDASGQLICVSRGP